MIKENYFEKLLTDADVEWKTLGEIALKISSGGTPKTSVLEYYNGDIPWLRTQEIDFCDIFDTGIKITEAGLKNSSAKIIPADCVIIAMYGATVGKTGINKIPMATNQACANIQIDAGIANYRYVFYYLTNQYEYIKSLGAGPQTNINSQIVKNLKIPIPTLKVQEEIVRILDTFTELISELTAEFTARKKQYAYYMDKLLTFKEGEAEWNVLDDVFDIFAGGDVPKNSLCNEETKEFNIPIISNGIGYNSIYGWTRKAKIEKPSLTISARGTIGWTNIIYTPFFPVVRLLVLTPKINLNLKYVYYYMKTIEDNYKVPKNGIPQLTKPMIKAIEIPIPSLRKQEEIVSILDKFYSLTNSITEGLPYEMELRQKQYEYYRNMLFSFPRDMGIYSIK